MGRGDRVGIVLQKGLPAVVSIFGVLKAGAAYVPVDATAPADRGRRILTDCAIRALIVDAGCLDVAPQGDDAANLAAVIVTSAEPAPHPNVTLLGTSRQHADQPDQLDQPGQPERDPERPRLHPVHVRIDRACPKA